MAENARRNDPCPCGSGRKYKRCCLRPGEGDLARAAAIHEMDDRLVSQMLGYGLQRFGIRFAPADAYEGDLGGDSRDLSIFPPGRCSTTRYSTAPWWSGSWRSAPGR